ncbi:hypothetical protein KQI68_06735 [Peptoniphilus sp. MSJ-1]|uniref:Uncharacterized protein n=1 Tax=Peptoniphilus ovalis TaxID=2841503 RepID=A0ABS6FH88_9FIRM|nr:hypothetical protein [Peptoniphilus ovalis]MBU5669534.1 hypothetical protein [Peptoniphilus ovalis]
MKRKSIEPKRMNNQKPSVIVIKKDLSIKDMLPDYQFEYDVELTSDEPIQIAESYRKFLEENSDLLLDGYNSKDSESIREGFKRAVAITELFFKSLYIDN